MCPREAGEKEVSNGRNKRVLTSEGLGTLRREQTRHMVGSLGKKKSKRMNTKERQ